MINSNSNSQHKHNYKHRDIIIIILDECTCFPAAFPDRRVRALPRLSASSFPNRKPSNT